MCEIKQPVPDVQESGRRYPRGATMATKKPLYLHPYMELQGSLDSPDGRGRRYVATKSVSQGAVLLVEEAIVASEPEQTVIPELRHHVPACFSSST